MIDRPELLRWWLSRLPDAPRKGKVVHYRFINGELYWYLDLGSY